MFETEKDHINILAILEAIDKIEKNTEAINSSEEFEKDLKSFDACLMNFIVIGEMTLRLSADFIDKHSEIEWYKIRALRNIAAHDYFGIDAEKVWDIIKTKLPELKKELLRIIESKT